MSNKKSKHETKTVTLSAYELEGALDKCIQKLLEVKEQFKPYVDTKISIEYDYSSCYYESDTPEIKIEIRGTAPCTN